MPLLQLLHLSIFIPQLCFLVFKILFRDLPEGIDFVLETGRCSEPVPLLATYQIIAHDSMMIGKLTLSSCM